MLKYILCSMLVINSEQNKSINPNAFLPLGPVTATDRGATPALLQSTVKDCGILARTPEPTPGPEIFTLLESTTSFTGTLNGLPIMQTKRSTL